MSAVFVTTAYGGPEHQQLTTREAPAPRAGEIAIEVRAAGVNPADGKRREGAFGTRGALPLALGLEASGVVTAVGEGVEGFTVGEAVLGAPARGLGAFAEHTVLKAGESVAAPDGVSFADAAALPIAGTTAYDLVHHRPLKAGATVVVLGAGGGVGRMVLQLARLRGLRTIGVASESKRALIEVEGARFVPSDAEVQQQVRELAPDGADLLIDLVGGPGAARPVPGRGRAGRDRLGGRRRHRRRVRRHRATARRGDAREGRRTGAGGTGGSARGAHVSAGRGGAGSRRGGDRPCRREDRPAPLSGPDAGAQLR